MKILLVNTFHYLRGGDCQHALGLGKLLEEAGHEVHHFAMTTKQNLPCSDESYFVSEIDFRNAAKKKNLINGIRVIWRSIYSVEAKKNIGKLLDEIKPDIVHLHSIRHHLTKSILPEIASREIPIVWTLHDYKEICPNTSFYNGHAICEMCKDKKHTNVLRNRCKKNSLPASFLTYLEAKINNNQRYNKFIDLYISPSNFLKNKFIEYGYNPQKITCLPNFIHLDGLVPPYKHENYFLYIGRLEQEKGLVSLIKAFSQTSKAQQTSILKIVGTGSQEEELKSLVKNLNLPQIEFLGYKQGRELEDLTKRAKCVIIPSEWYENYPFAALEAMAYGIPIIASRIGGIPEQVEDGVTGFLAAPFNPPDLADKIDLLNSLTKKDLETMGRRARKKVERVNSERNYLSQILATYSRLIESNKAVN